MGRLRNCVKMPTGSLHDWERAARSPATTVIAIFAAIHALGGIQIDIAVSNAHIILTALA